MEIFTFYTQQKHIKNNNNNDDKGISPFESRQLQTNKLLGHTSYKRKG